MGDVAARSAISQGGVVKAERPKLMAGVGPADGPIRPKKRFGQHFLVSPTILRGILHFAAVTPADDVLEIGAGTGTLTEALAGAAHRVVALELDRELITRLRQRFCGKPHVEILHADALQFDFEHLDAPVKVVANLPYGTAVPILTRLLQASSRIRLVVVMLQREVAERLCATPGTKAYGSLTLMAQWHGVVEKGFKVPPAAFFPPPRVMSSMVRITPHPTPPVPVRDEVLLFQIIRGAFSQRRKTLANALGAAMHQRLDRHVLRQSLGRATIDPNRRGETLTLSEFARLADALWETLADG
jgi:16S rRNA (adenine1518-N6/adenine1519-N6)-dimethyltransferase